MLNNSFLAIDNIISFPFICMKKTCHNRYLKSLFMLFGISKQQVRKFIWRIGKTYTLIWVAF